MCHPLVLFIRRNVRLSRACAQCASRLTPQLSYYFTQLQIEYVTLLKESNGRSRGMAYINYKKPDHAKLAIEQMNNFELAGMTLKV